MPSNRRRIVTFFACVTVAALLPAPARAVPSFARQTHMACSVCHTQFPELTEFGREFKISGYTMSADAKTEDKDKEGDELLSLPTTVPISLMFQTSYSRSAHRIPSDVGFSKNGDVLFPDQLSIFLAGGITPKVGVFVQTTYDAQGGQIGLDNTDLRYADQLTVSDTPLVVGVSVNNSPTVQDPWSSTPTWGFPYASSSVEPTPAAATLIDGGLAQQVAGASAYLYADNMIYAELGVYESAPIGVSRPLDGNDTDVALDPIPYWRAAFTRTFGDHYVELGTYGLSARLSPGGGQPLQGATDRFTDVAFDLTYQLALDGNWFTTHATYIHEDQNLAAAAAAGAADRRSHTLETARLDATYYWGQRLAFTLAPFGTFGSGDSTLYGAAAVSGSRNGKVSSDGLISQVSYNPWENTRLSLQYVAYFDFNGSSSNYDGSGRDASDNNTLFFLVWLMF